MLEAKGKRGQKRTSALVEGDTVEPKTKATQITEEPEPATTPMTTSTVAVWWGLRLQLLHVEPQWRGCTS
jgi:hypothetical protein